MKKIKKTILWISLFAVPIGIITPMINYSISIDEKNNKILKNFNSLEDKLSILDNSLNQEQQVDLFKDVKINDILSKL